jgi:hypothetical protein
MRERVQNVRDAIAITIYLDRQKTGRQPKESSGPGNRVQKASFPRLRRSQGPDPQVSLLVCDTPVYLLFKTSCFCNVQAAGLLNVCTLCLTPCRMCAQTASKEECCRNFDVYRRPTASATSSFRWAPVPVEGVPALSSVSVDRLEFRHDLKLV